MASDDEPSKLATLAIDFDRRTDIVTIEGVRYAGSLFREFGAHGMKVGQIFRIISREDDGVVSIQRIGEIKHG